MDTLRRTPRPHAPLALAPLALCAVLGACGGETTSYEAGPGSASAPATASPGAPAAALPANPYAADVVVPEAASTTTGNIVVEPAFDFSSDRDVGFVIDVPEARGSTTYLNLCLEWEVATAAGAPAYEVDYGSCVLRTTMTDGYYEGDVALANQHGSMLAVIWFTDPDRAPVYRELRADDA